MVITPREKRSVVSLTHPLDLKMGGNRHCSVMGEQVWCCHSLPRTILASKFTLGLRVLYYDFYGF